MGGAPVGRQVGTTIAIGDPRVVFVVPGGATALSLLVRDQPPIPVVPTAEIKTHVR